jgi:hypothetical protein
LIEDNSQRFQSRESHIARVLHFFDDFTKALDDKVDTVSIQYALRPKVSRHGPLAIAALPFERKRRLRRERSSPPPTIARISSNAKAAVAELKASQQWLFPKLLGRELGAFGERLKLRPRDLLMDATAEAAIRTRNEVFPADNLRIAHDAIGHDLRMLDDIGGVADDARNE